MIADYGRRSGYNQIAPNRDIEELDENGRPRRARTNIQNAIGAVGQGAPLGEFAGASTVKNSGDYQPPTGGITGGMNPQAAPAPSALQQTIQSVQAQTPDYTKLGQYAGGLSGYNMDKFNRPLDQLSEKYRIGLVQSHFDPTKGITPEFIQALNDANIYGAKFAGEGDKLNVVDTGGHSRFGQGGIGDVVQGLKSGQGKWTYWSDPNLQQQAPQGGINNLMPAILGNVPTGQQPEESYADKYRKMIMQALGVSPDLQAIGKTFGY